MQLQISGQCLVSVLAASARLSQTFSLRAYYHAVRNLECKPEPHVGEDLLHTDCCCYSCTCLSAPANIKQTQPSVSGCFVFYTHKSTVSLAFHNVLDAIRRGQNCSSRHGSLMCRISAREFSFPNLFPADFSLLLWVNLSDNSKDSALLIWSLNRYALASIQHRPQQSISNDFCIK